MTLQHSSLQLDLLFSLNFIYFGKAKPFRTLTQPCWRCSLVCNLNQPSRVVLCIFLVQLSCPHHNDPLLWDSLAITMKHCLWQLITIISLFFLMTDFTKFDVTVWVYELYPINDLCQTSHQNQTAFVQQSYFWRKSKRIKLFSQLSVMINSINS